MCLRHMGVTKCGRKKSFYRQVGVTQTELWCHFELVQVASHSIVTMLFVALLINLNAVLSYVPNHFWWLIAASWCECQG